MPLDFTLPRLQSGFEIADWNLDIQGSPGTHVSRKNSCICVTRFSGAFTPYGHFCSCADAPTINTMSYKDLKAYHNTNLDLSITDRVKAIEYAICHDPNYEGWDTAVLRGAKLLSATAGRTEWEFEVTPSMCNKGGNLHGGCACTILDNLSSTTLLTLAKEGFLDAGSVSRTITMTYLRPVPAGTKVKIIAEAVAAGKTLAHCKAEIRTMDGKVAVTCVHDKAVVPRPKPKL